MYFFILILLFILLFQVSSSGPEHFQEEHFTKNFELPLRGFFTLVIVYHHLSQYLDNPGPFRVFLEVGILCVAAFFFYSGYGLMKSVLTNKNYFHHFFLRRYIKIFVPFFICNALYLFVYYLTGDRYGLKLSLEYLSGIQLINPQSWYIIVIALFYFVFFLSFRFIRKKGISFLLLGIFQIVFPTYCMAKGPSIYWFQGEWWFNSSSLFFIGILMAQFEKPIMKFTRKWYYWLLLLSAGTFLYFFPKSVQVLDQIEPLLTNEHIFVKEMIGNWICFIWQTIAVINFMIFVFLLTLKIRFSNKFLSFLGTRSFEIYLIHGLFLEVFRSDRFYIQSDFLYTAAVLVLSLGCASLMYYPFKMISRKLEEYSLQLYS